MLSARKKVTEKKIAKETRDIQYTRNTQGFNVSIDTVQAVVHDERVVDYINAIESKATQDRNSVTAKEHNIYLGYLASIIALKHGKRPSVGNHMRWTEFNMAKKTIIDGQNHYAVFVRDHKTSISNGPDVTILTEEEHSRFHCYATYIRRKFADERNDRLKEDRLLFRLPTGQSKPVSCSSLINELHMKFNLPVYQAGDSRKIIETYVSLDTAIEHTKCFNKLMQHCAKSTNDSNHDSNNTDNVLNPEESRSSTPSTTASSKEDSDDKHELYRQMFKKYPVTRDGEIEMSELHYISSNTELRKSCINKWRYERDILRGDFVASQMRVEPTADNIVIEGEKYGYKLTAKKHLKRMIAVYQQKKVLEGAMRKMNF